MGWWRNFGLFLVVDCVLRTAGSPFIWNYADPLTSLELLNYIISWPKIESDTFTDHLEYKMSQNNRKRVGMVDYYVYKLHVQEVVTYLSSNLLHIMGHYFLDIQYTNWVVNVTSQKLGGNSQYYDQWEAAIFVCIYKRQNTLTSDFCLRVSS